MNEVLKTIAERFSCRGYDGVLPSREKLDAIALAAVQAPSAVNEQPWEIVVVTNKNLIEDMDREGMEILKSYEDKSFYQRFMDRGGNLYYNAPCMFFVLKQPEKDLDCGIVAENIALAAKSLGLGSVICGMAEIPLEGARGEEFKNKIGITDGWEFGIAILVGNGTKEATPHEPDMSKIRYIE